MKISQAGLELIKKWEGIRLVAYADSKGLATIGIGTIKGLKQSDIGKKRITEAEAYRLLMEDLVEREKAINALIKVPVTQSQYDAIVSLTYNIGVGALKNSTVLRKLNAGDNKGAAAGFLLFNKQTNMKTGKKEFVQGLANRRADEKKFFEKGGAAVTPAKPLPVPTPKPVLDHNPKPEVRGTTKPETLVDYLNKWFGK